MKLTSFFLALESLPSLANLSPNQLKCEYSDNPPGIDNPQPRLNWILESKQRAENQTAYQILAATSEAMLKSDHGDLWDTGKVASDQSAQVVYAGKAPGSCQRCCWKVRVTHPFQSALCQFIKPWKRPGARRQRICPGKFCCHRNFAGPNWCNRGAKSGKLQE